MQSAFTENTMGRLERRKLDVVAVQGSVVVTPDELLLRLIQFIAAHTRQKCALRIGGMLLNHVVPDSDANAGRLRLKTLQIDEATSPFRLTGRDPNTGIAHLLESPSVRSGMDQAGPRLFLMGKLGGGKN